MNGQLWEPCRCGEEPVCVDCGYCERHCRCQQRQQDAEQTGEFNRRYPGFLDRAIRHDEDGSREH